MSYKLNTVITEDKVNQIAKLLGLKVEATLSTHNEPICYKLTSELINISLYDIWNSSTHVQLAIRLPITNKHSETTQKVSKSLAALTKAIQKWIDANLADIKAEYKAKLSKAEYNQHTKDSILLVCDSYRSPKDGLTRIQFFNASTSAYLPNHSGSIECAGLFTTITNLRLPTKQACEVLQLLESFRT